MHVILLLVSMSSKELDMEVVNDHKDLTNYHRVHQQVMVQLHPTSGITQLVPPQKSQPGNV